MALTKVSGPMTTAGTVSVKDFGAVGDGVTDDTDVISTAVSTSAVVEVPLGTYLYKATTTADPTKFDFKQGASFVGTKALTKTISVRDKAEKFIGLQHNYNEETSATAPITTGAFMRPPMSDAAQTAGMDVIAHFYNDFGLESTRAAGGGLGSTEWYTWKWNHTTNTTYGVYDPKRHPLLGWYRGDDPIALDWICYWLKEAGIAGVHLAVGAVDTTTWTSNTSVYYWLYKLFTDVPNFKGLKYVMGGYVAESKAAWEANWEDVKTNILDVYRNYHTTTINGKTYGTIYIYDMGTARTGIFASNAAFETWLKGMATFFQGHGHAGVCVLGRNGGYYTASTQTKNTAQVLNDFGVYVFDSAYGGFTGSYTSPTVYSDYVNNFASAYAAVKFRTIPNVMTAHESKYHPSGWTETGSTPALFEKVIQIAANAASANDTIPNIITVYNVSEWGEGGASLQPNMQDGFGYLDAIRKIGGASNSSGKAMPAVFSGNTVAKTGTATTAVAFTAATFTVSYSSISRCEVTLAALENTIHYAGVTRKYIFTLYNYNGTLSASAVNVDVASTSDKSSPNYSMTPTVSVNIESPTSATFQITLTAGGVIGWATAEYVVSAGITSVDPASIS